MPSPVIPPAHSLIRNLPLPWRIPCRTPIFRLPPRAFASKHPQRAGGKPRVLEKPARFNPPSHGSRLPSGKGPPLHYGGPVSEIEIKAQARRDYPGLPPPPGSFAHKFWNNPKLHAWITIGTLTSLATYTLSRRFQENSPYAHLLPPWSDVLHHPIASFWQSFEVLRLHVNHNTREALDSRRGALEDITKRKKYNRAHDVEEKSFVHAVVPQKYLRDVDRAMEERYGTEGANGDGDGVNQGELGRHQEEAKRSEEGK